MSTPEKLSAKVHETLQTTESCFTTETISNYQELDHQVRELEALAREGFQAHLNNEYRSIVKKLEQGTALTPEERKTLELLIVGEAKYYLKHENDFNNWTGELKRLADEMQTLESSGLDNIDDVMHLQALCRDARNILPDITFYLQEKERVQRFETSTKGEIDPQSGQILADMIRAMMDSDKM